MQVLECVLAQDGVVYSFMWQNFGITPEEERLILHEFNKFIRHKNNQQRNNNESKTNRQQDNRKD
jgi:hypothetical protein